MWTFNMIENSPASFDILTSSLQENCSEVSSKRHRMFRSRKIWNSVPDDPNPSAGSLLISYSYILYWCLRHGATRKYRGIVAGAFTFANGFLFLFGRLFRVPVIGLGFAEEFTLAMRGRGFKNLIKRNWIRLTHKYAAGFVVVCDFCKELLVSLGVDKDKIAVVPANVNEHKLSLPVSAKKAGHRILSVGRLVERKGFHFLIDAVAFLKDDIPDIRLHIVGDGPYRGELEKKIKKLNLKDHVILEKLVPDERLATLYNESDIFVLANVMLENGDVEGCPVVFSEASGNRLPVIGGEEGGASTAIDTGKTGYILNPRDVELLADRIREVLLNPELARSMGEAGFEKVMRDHTGPVTGNKFFQAVQTLVSNSHPVRDNRLV